MLPFTTASSTVNTLRNPANPFDNGRNLAGRMGLDLKMGLGPGLTLQATVNPDFGQVEADPAEVNLTAVPTRFSERRPFFVDDSQLLSVTHPNFLYTRRIGARPPGAASGDFVDFPITATILGAAKVTGRIRPRTSLGVLTAVTSEESARIASAAAPGVTSIRVGVPTTYGVARMQQEIGSLGSTAGFLLVGSHRSMDAQDPLARTLSRNAFAAAGDATLRFRGGEFEFRSVTGVSFVSGEAGAIERFQRGSSHFAQRPDREYARLDSTATSLSGFSTQTALERISGRHWLWAVSMKIDTPAFETNDFAQLNSADGLQPNATLRYRETRPGRFLRNYTIGLNQSAEWNFGLNRQAFVTRPSANVTWRNFWTSSIAYSRIGATKDASLTRGGPLMQAPPGWSTTMSLANNSAGQTRWSGSVTTAGNDDGGLTRRVNGSFAFRPGPRWQLSVTPSYERLIDTQQYVMTLGGGRPETYGGRYVFAEIDRSTYAAQFRMNYTVRPDLNLDVYAEPFAASGHYYDYGELSEAGSRSRIAYGRSGTTLVPQLDGSLVVSAGGNSFKITNRNFNVRSFRSNVVLRFEYRPGSTLYVVWQQDRRMTETVGTRVALGDLARSITGPGSHTFLIKTSFWLPVR